MPHRHLNWPNCYNTRDLGGLPAAGGKETRWGAVIRSDVLNRLTEEGQEALRAYGVRTIIDLRAPQEAAEDPSLFATDENLTYLNLPLETFEPHVGDLIGQAKTHGEIYSIILDHYPDEVATVMRAIAQAEPGGIVIHCHAGKDRTALVSALLLRLVGVPVEEVAADYAVSQVRLWPLYEKTVAAAGNEDEVGFWAKPSTTKETMLETLAHLDAEYGGVPSYLSAVGLTPGEMEQLKRRLCAK